MLMKTFLTTISEGKMQTVFMGLNWTLDMVWSTFQGEDWCRYKEKVMVTQKNYNGFITEEVSMYKYSWCQISATLDGCIKE